MNGRMMWRKRWMVAGLALVSLVLYLALVAGEPGLPLDDSWIHQTYARNLAQTGRWEYISGTISAGSTAPLWTLLLTAGYVLSMPPLPWTYLLGWLGLVWIAWAGMSLWLTLWPDKAGRVGLPGAVLAISWPLVWAAGSGMETLLFGALALQVLALYGQYLRRREHLPDQDGQEPGGRLNDDGRLALLGLLAGIMVMTRPEGLALVGLIALGLLLSGESVKGRIRQTAIFVIIAAIALLPYFALNFRAGGRLWPNTYYAKQAEYAFLWATPLIQRFGQLLFFALGGPAEGWRGLSGAHLLLLPGVLWAGWSGLRKDWDKRRLLHTLPLIWAAGHVFLYAWRLPVTYQHGRYLWPVLPVLILYGLAGWLHLLDLPKALMGTGPRFDFVWRMVAGLTFIMLLVIFMLLGALAFRQDVDLINGEMVDVAHWLQENTPEEALVAAHDIGALGYFAGRPLLDLAGLITPDVVPLLADEEALARYVRQHGADYLVTAPGWPYPSLTESEESILVYSSEYAWTRDQGVNNMAIYRLK